MNIPKTTAFTIAIPVFFLIASSTLAFNLPGQATNRPTGYSNGVPQVSTARQNTQTRLKDAKLKVCQARENGIKQRSSRLTQLVTTMENKFDAIVQRVEDYYNSKVVPSGKSVSNYNSLISDIQTKKAAVQTALSKTQSDVSGFSCTSDNPKGQMTQFREDMQAVKRALKEYRTSIKSLIVAVRSVTGVQNSERSGSPRPSKRPKGENQ